jgi:hypothetical protein
MHKQHITRIFEYEQYRCYQKVDWRFGNDNYSMVYSDAKTPLGLFIIAWQKRRGVSQIVVVYFPVNFPVSRETVDDRYYCEARAV